MPQRRCYCRGSRLWIRAARPLGQRRSFQHVRVCRRVFNDYFDAFLVYNRIADRLAGRARCSRQDAVKESMDMGQLVHLCQHHAHSTVTRPRCSAVHARIAMATVRALSSSLHDETWALQWARLRGRWPPSRARLSQSPCAGTSAGRARRLRTAPRRCAARSACCRRTQPRRGP